MKIYVVAVSCPKYEKTGDKYFKTGHAVDPEVVRRVFYSEYDALEYVENRFEKSNIEHTGTRSTIRHLPGGEESEYYEICYTITETTLA